MKKTRVMLIDDDEAMLDLTKFQLQSRGYEVTTADTGEIGLKLNAELRCDIALTDLQLPDIDGIELVKQMKELSPTTEIIMVTGYSSVNTAIEATKAGAFYFVEKPVEYEELFVLLEKALEHGRQAEEIRQLRGRLRSRDSYYNLIGSSKAMQNLYEVIDSVAESDANILIVGESGTGKELIANAIHFKSLRAKKPFVKINCSALPKELIESELFGHTKGAFTGAATDKIGLIGQATGGSLMLDEIGEMPVELQPKLLRVLQERVYYRIGSEKAHEADFRLISATNRNPLDALREGHLREDLYYRINTIEIQVPPLRERAEDVQHLAEHFLRMYAEKYHRPVRSISRQAYERMFAYNWPGNVRELQNVIERAVLLSKGEVVEEQIVPQSQPAAVQTSSGAAVSLAAPFSAPVNAAAASTAVGANAVDGSIKAADLTMEQLGRLIVSRLSNPKGGPRLDIFTRLEGVIVSAALERTRGNKQAAAGLLGLYRPRLYSLLRKHNLHDTIREVAHRDGDGSSPDSESIEMEPAEARELLDESAKTAPSPAGEEVGDGAGDGLAEAESNAIRSSTARPPDHAAAKAHSPATPR